MAKAIANKFTIEKMKKKNEKSIVVNKKTGEITKDGKTFKNKAEYSSAMKKQRADKKANTSPKWWEGRKAKEARASKASIASGKANKAATQKIYAAESMFKSAKARDDAKTTPGKARPFKEAFDSATKADKDSFMWKGKSYFTTRGAAENRDKKKTRIAPKGTYPKKSKLDADTVKSYKKRIAWMKKRKEAGKGYSAKNLAELEAKLKDM